MLDLKKLPMQYPKELAREWETLLGFKYVAAPQELWGAVREWLVRQAGEGKEWGASPLVMVAPPFVRL